MTGVIFLTALTPAGAAAQSRSGKNATFLQMFPREHMDCGKKGWNFTGLLAGATPVTACILKYKGNAGKSPFGPL